MNNGDPKPDPNEGSDDIFARMAGEEHLLPEQVAKRNLMGHLLEGKITLEQAEARARSHGFALYCPPDPKGYDPLTLDAWPLPMALAWIMWRNFEDVRRHWIEYRAVCHEWKGSQRGIQLEPLTPRMSSFFFLQNDELIQRDEGHAPQVSAGGARHQLWRALRAGKIEMIAIDVSSRSPVIVPKEQFVHLAIPEYADGKAADALLLGDSEAFTQPLLQVEQVMELWPQHANEQGRGHASNPIHGNNSPSPVGHAKDSGTIRQSDRRGRKKNGGPYDALDRKLVEEMQCLRKSGTGRPASRYAAAQQLSPKAQGSSSGDSKARRLERKHSKDYPGVW